MPFKLVCSFFCVPGQVESDLRPLSDSPSSSSSLSWECVPVDPASPSFLLVSLWSIPLCAETVPSALSLLQEGRLCRLGVDSMCQEEEVGSVSSKAASLDLSLFYVVDRGVLILSSSENVIEINIMTLTWSEGFSVCQSLIRCFIDF